MAVSPHKVDELHTSHDSLTLWSLVEILLPKDDAGMYYATDTLLIILFHAAFSVAALTITGRSTSTKSACIAGIMVGVFIPWNCRTPLLRGIYGLWSAVIVCRLLQLRNHLFSDPSHDSLINAEARKPGSLTAVADTSTAGGSHDSDDTNDTEQESLIPSSSVNDAHCPSGSGGSSNQSGNVHSLNISNTRGNGSMMNQHRYSTQSVMDLIKLGTSNQAGNGGSTNEDQTRVINIIHNSMISPVFFTAKPLLFRLIFVHFFHDLRLSYLRNRMDTLKEVVRLQMVNLSMILVCSFMSEVLTVETLQLMFGISMNAKYWYLFTVLVFTLIYSVCALYLVDCFFRLLLIPFGYDVISTMQSPLYSASVSDFWGRRWNIHVQLLLREFIYLPSQKLVSKHSDKLPFFIHACFSGDDINKLPLFITFGVSSMLHFYPLFLIIKDVNLQLSQRFSNGSSSSSEGNSSPQLSGLELHQLVWTGFLLMSLYFLIQAACVITEQKLQISQHRSKVMIKVWIFGYTVCMSPLFFIPLLMTLRLYQ